MLAVFTPSNHADLKQIFDAIQLVQACITSVEKTKRAKILQNAIKSCDDLQLKWDDIGLCNRNGFLTKRGGNVKVSVNILGNSQGFAEALLPKW